MYVDGPGRVRGLTLTLGLEVTLWFLTSDLFSGPSRGVQRSDPEPRADRRSEGAAARGGEEDLHNLLPGGEPGQDPLPLLHRGGDTQQYVTSS